MSVLIYDLYVLGSASDVLVHLMMCWEILLVFDLEFCGVD